MADRPLRGYRLIEIQHGDTPQSLAARALGDASKWVAIADINGLTPPYFTGDAALAGETVKLYGQSILVPSIGVDAPAIVDPDRVYGVDLDLSGGQLSAVDGDLALISGRPNLRQAINHRIVTDLQELLFHLSYGCGVRRVLGTANGPASGLLGAQYVKSALDLDPRIESILSCTAEVVGDQVIITARIQPISGAAFDISTGI